MLRAGTTRTAQVYGTVTLHGRGQVCVRLGSTSSYRHAIIARRSPEAYARAGCSFARSLDRSRCGIMRVRMGRDSRVRFPSCGACERESRGRPVDYATTRQRVLGNQPQVAGWLYGYAMVVHRDIAYFTKIEREKKCVGLQYACFDQHPTQHDFPLLLWIPHILQ